jgi:D-alanyl-D-alanine dipeptidase
MTNSIGKIDRFWVKTLIVSILITFVPILGFSQDDEIFRIYPQYSYEELLQKAKKASPPTGTEHYRTVELVELIDNIPNLRLEVRYATRNNFMGMKFYKSQRAFLQKPAADALASAAMSLELHGMGIIVYDAYRPWYVTKMFWDATPDSLKNYVANPLNGSRHNRGCAVDIGLYYLSTGEKVAMPTDYDDFTKKAHMSFQDTTQQILSNRQLLQETMKKAGFEVYEFEWWHFDFKDWNKYPILNLTFEEL